MKMAQMILQQGILTIFAEGNSIKLPPESIYGNLYWYANMNLEKSDY
jgi:hypothetical protein